MLCNKGMIRLARGGKFFIPNESILDSSSQLNSSSESSNLPEYNDSLDSSFALVSISYVDSASLYNSCHVLGACCETPLELHSLPMLLLVVDNGNGDRNKMRQLSSY